ncbi:MAG: AMP-binding protein [Pseudolabrys sp.]
MIASGTQPTDDNRTTLDGLFRRAGVRHAGALALVDPPNRESFIGGSPRRLTYAQADRAISAFAAKLRDLGLTTDAVVAMQLPNTVESVIALLGVLRAGMVAAPVPQLWRKLEMVEALSRAGVKAIVTSAGTGSEIAMQVAAELFPIRAIAGFGRDLPDGVVPLDDVFASNASGFRPATRPGDPAARSAVVTFDITGDGIVPIARSHSELIADGCAVFHEAGIAHDTTTVSTIPLGSLAGIALAMVPWLLGGGTLALHLGFSPAAFAEQCSAHDATTTVLPGPILETLAGAGLLGAPIKTILALWRTPEQLAIAATWQGPATIVDVSSFDEGKLVSARRGSDGRPVVHDEAASPHAAGLVSVGGYRFIQDKIDNAVAAIDPAAIIAALPHALLGQRLAGQAGNPTAIAVALQTGGANALIAEAFRPRQTSA